MTTQLINDHYLQMYSLFPQNYDLTEVQNFVKIAENIHIKPILGDALYNALLTKINEDTLDEDYSELLIEIYQLEGLCVYYESLPFVWAHLSAVGITVGKSDNSDSINSDELMFILKRLESNINFHKDSLKEYLTENAEKFPEYKVEDTCTPQFNNKSKLFYNFFKENWNIE